MAQVAPLCALPFLTKMYTVDQFDTLALFISIVSLFSILATLRLDISLPQLKSETLAKVTASFSVCLIFIASSIALIVMYNISVFETKFLDMLLPVGVALFSLYSLQSFSLTRQGRVKDLLVVKLLLAIGVAVLQITLAYFTQIEGALIVSILVGHLLIVSLTLVFISTTRIKLHTLPNYVASYRKNKHYIFYTLPDSLINSLNHYFPVFLFSYFLLESYSALYFMALKLFYTPVTIVTSVYGRLFQSKLRSYSASGKENRLIIETIRSVLKLTFCLCLFYLLFADLLIARFLGSDWIDLYAIILVFSPWVLMQSVVSPISTILIFKGHQKFLFKVNLFFLGFKFLLVMMAIEMKLNPFIFIGMSSMIMYAIIFRKIFYINNLTVNKLVNGL
jgi:O-antigen/teichoic acid export membrane protein